MLLILVFSVSASFASENVDSMQVNHNETLFVNEVSQDDASSESSMLSTSHGSAVENDEVLDAAVDSGKDVLGVQGTFSELNTYIASEGNVKDLDKDYSRGSASDIITIDKELTIDGHGFTLNGENKEYYIFKVTNWLCPIWY